MNALVPERFQAAFDGERKNARARGAADGTLARKQTIRMYGRVAALQGEAIARGDVALACARGCSYCCHLRVEMRPHEAFALAHHIQTTFGAEERAHIVSRIEQNLARIADLTPEQHIRAGMPCALLERDACVRSVIAKRGDEEWASSLRAAALRPRPTCVAGIA